MEITRQENVMQHLNNVLLVGVMITTTVVYIYAQDQPLGILLETIRQNFARYFVLRDFMQTATQEQDNALLLVQGHMTFTVIRQECMILSVMMKQIVVKLIV